MTRRARIAFLCHGAEGSPPVERARGISAHLVQDFDIEIIPRLASTSASTTSFAHAIATRPPDAAYVIDVSPAGIAAALCLRKALGLRMVVDTGDAVHALARASAMRGELGLALTWAMEEVALWGADRVVTRGSYHSELLRARGIPAVTIPDGVDVEVFRPRAVPELRSRLAPGAALVVGVVGSLTLNRRTKTCYGWDLLEALAALPDIRVHGIVIGDGDGLPWLLQRARVLGVSGRVTFVGRMPLNELPPYVNAMDVALSTQTNDVVGQVRTTGKLPIYMATGRYVLATRVGEAARVLDDGQLLEFDGAWDPGHPTRLAQRLRELVGSPQQLARARERNVEVARERFAYPVIARQVSSLLREVLNA